MKVFVFQPSNAPVGSFEVESLDALDAGLEKFRRIECLEAYDFLECAGRRWTLMAGPSGLELVEGKVDRPESAALDPSPAARLLRRYRRAYRVGASALGFSKVLAGIGWGLGVVTALAGCLGSSQVAQGEAVLFLLYAFIAAAVQVVVFMFFSVLVSVLGEILRASLDTAIHTSLFLDEQQKSEVVDEVTKGF